MPLKLTVAALDALPEALRPFYAKGDDGLFHLALEGAPPGDARMAQLERRLEDMLVEAALREAAGEAGVRRAALPDVLNRGRSAFRVEGDAVVPAGDGPAVASWIEALRQEAPHLFQPSSGGGAPGSGRPATTRVLRRGDQAAFNAHLDGIARGRVRVRG